MYAGRVTWQESSSKPVSSSGLNRPSAQRWNGFTLFLSLSGTRSAHSSFVIVFICALNRMSEVSETYYFNNAYLSHFNIYIPKHIILLTSFRTDSSPTHGLSIDFIKSIVLVWQLSKLEIVRDWILQKYDGNIIVLQ